MDTINYLAPVNSLSYGLVGLNVLKQLDKNGYNVAWKPIGGVEANNSDGELLTKCYNNEFDQYATSLRIFHEFDCAEHIGIHKHISWPIFEITNFTGQRRRHLQAPDYLIVCSQWGKEVLENNGITKNGHIYVVPLGVDVDIFFPSKQAKPDELTFIHVSKREYRKSQYEMLQCFESAFTPADNVKLKVVWGSPLLQQRNPREHDKWTKLFRQSPLANKIELIEWVPSQLEIASLLNSADCGLFLSKAEGFGLGCLESLACGLQNITLNYSGVTEFSTPSNSLLVEPTTYEDIYDGVWFTEPNMGKWAAFGEDQTEQTVAYMRSLYERKMNGDNLFNAEGTATAKQFTWENTFNKLENILG